MLLEDGDEVLGRYRVEEFLGQSGSGRRYLARHILLGHVVVVKTLRSMRDGASVARFERAIGLMKRIRDPHIASVLDHSGEDEAPCVVSEFVDGFSLRQALDSGGALAWQDALEILDRVLVGLAALHREHILHRNLKPDNILVAPDDPCLVKLTDLGYAKPMTTPAGDRRITKTGMAVGTPAYMSPEQLQLRTIDPRSDLYTAGLILYEALTGALPDDGADLGQLMRRAVAGPPMPRAPDSLPPVPVSVQDLVVRVLSPDPGGRPPTAVEFSEEIRVALQLDEAPTTRGAAGTRARLESVEPPERVRRPSVHIRIAPATTRAANEAASALRVPGRGSPPSTPAEPFGSPGARKKPETDRPPPSKPSASSSPASGYWQSMTARSQLHSPRAGVPKPTPQRTPMARTAARAKLSAPHAVPAPAATARGSETPSASEPEESTPFQRRRAKAAAFRPRAIVAASLPNTEDTDWLLDDLPPGSQSFFVAGRFWAAVLHASDDQPAQASAELLVEKIRQRHKVRARAAWSAVGAEFKMPRACLEGTAPPPLEVIELVEKVAGR